MQTATPGVPDADEPVLEFSPDGGSSWHPVASGGLAVPLRRRRKSDPSVVEYVTATLCDAPVPAILAQPSQQARGEALSAQLRISLVEGMPDLAPACAGVAVPGCTCACERVQAEGQRWTVGTRDFAAHD